jgi:hypothetical protein
MYFTYSCCLHWSPDEKDYDVNDINHLMMEVKEILKLKLDVSIVYDILIFEYIRRLARKGIDAHAQHICRFQK